MHFAFAFLLLAANASDLTDARALQRQALEAHRAGDEATFLTKIQAASALRPHHAGVLYQLAMAYALNGRADDALATLNRVATMGLALKPGDAKEFASLDLREVSARFTENTRPHGTAAKAFTIDKPGLIAEGMAYDTKTGRFFVSSVRTKSIYAIDHGHARPFVTGMQWGVFGMAIDPAKRILWAATSALPQVEGFKKEDAGHAAVLKIDLTTGKVLATLTANDTEKHTFGDVAISADGSVLVSDSVSPTMYRVAGDHLEPFVRGPFGSMQGIAVTPKRIYVSDYARGIYALDPETRDLHLLPIPTDSTLLGVDGLYAAGRNVLIATQNGTTPNRVLKLLLSADGLKVDRVETLAANDPKMIDLTLGVIARGQFYFNGNAQWDAWDDDGALVKGAKLEPLRVLRVGFAR